MRKCRSCGGVFAPVLPDGVRYFHACPSLSRAELAAAVAAGTIRLRPGETVDDAYTLRLYERPNRRDENVVADPDPTKPARIKTPGAGVDELP